MTGAALVAIASAAVPATQGGVDAAPACKPSETVVWLALQGDSAAGSTYVTLEMTNLSRRTCKLYGFPGVSAVDLAGRQIGAAAGRDPATTPESVRITPGQAAKAVLRIAHIGVFPRARCHPVQAAGLRVYLPGATQSRIVPFPLGACSRTGSVFLHVRAVEPAA